MKKRLWKIILAALLLLLPVCAYATPITKDFYTDGQIVDGNVFDTVNIWNTANVTMSGGEVDYLYCYDSSHLSLTGGESSQVWYAHDNSVIDISGGEINTLRSYEASHISMTGGYVFIFSIYDSSLIELKGGQLNSVYPNGNVFHVYGYNLEIDNSNPNFHGFIVSGYWEDMITPFLFTVSRNEPEDGVIILHEIPEPCTFGLISFGFLFARRTVKSLRK